MPDDTQFQISPMVKKKYPDLIKLIMESESMTDDERTYWFQLLPVMNEGQVDRLRSILEKEKAQMAKLEAEYTETVDEISDDSLARRSLFPQRVKRKKEKLQKSESLHEKAEAAHEAALLEELQNF